jgi:hypothetical protein
MKKLSVLLSVVLGLLWSMAAPAVLDRELVALHWHPESAEQARRHTLAVAAWLEEAEADADLWRQGVEARIATLERRAELVPPAWSSAADGMFAWLVHARDQNLTTGRPGAALPMLHRIDELLRQEDAAGRIARLYPVAALEAPQVWTRLAERLRDADKTAAAIESTIDAFWAPLRAQHDERSEPPEWNAHAQHQAERVLGLQSLGSAEARERAVVELLLAEARLSWERGQRLAAVWVLFEGLIRLTAIEGAMDLAAEYQDALLELAGPDARELRQLDVDLPVILAMMLDAAGYLAVEEAGVIAATTELADAYARLALFIVDAAYYLDQPVREDIRLALVQCNPDPLLVGPLPRELFEACLERLSDLLLVQLDREELVGGPGPFAPEFFRREMGLVSWQRGIYLDGHTAWRLEEPCDAPQWVNLLEWSMLLQYLAHWVPQRPVFFGTPRWQAAVDQMLDQARSLQADQRAWLDCMTGMGRERRDPVQRLLGRLERSHVALAAAIEEAQAQYYADVTRPGADIDLDRDADQQTSYRPETLTVRPCAELDSCGARVELPVSRALLGLFPNAHLLADQLGLGQLQLCYGNVRWVEREARPARAGDPRVANYHGRLSFDLIGSFVQGDNEDLVFHQRLTAHESRHYLFAGSDPDLLDLECPRSLAGAPIASELPEGRPGLVPNRLTYFASTPTTAEVQLLANWDRGAEWRDWFVTGGRVETLESSSGEALLAEVQSQLASLVSRRERQLSARLLSAMPADDSDALGLAMADIAEYVALLRRLMELHYPRVIRHDDELRALLVGDAGLLNRDRVRQLRDAGLPMAQVPTLGRERLEHFIRLWSELPLALRESGQSSPELDYGLEQLDKLIWLSRYWPGGVEPSAER